MPSHYCIDPYDQYSQSELLVEFEASGAEVKLISARDASDDDVLCELEDIERRALESEIAADYRQDDPSRDRHPLRGPTPDRP